MRQIRDMRASDIEAVSAIRVRGWQSAYAGVVPQAYLDGMSVEGDARRRRAWFGHPGRRATDLVAVDAEGPVGWLSLGPARAQALEGSARTGEVHALYVRPDLTGLGIGQALLDEAHARLKDRGFLVSVLWVLAENPGARRFYERAGYEPDGGTQDDLYDDGTVLTELRYRRGL